MHSKIHKVIIKYLCNSLSFFTALSILIRPGQLPHTFYVKDYSNPILSKTKDHAKDTPGNWYNDSVCCADHFLQ